MMQATEMNHPLNMLTPALGEEAGSGSALSVQEKQEVNSSSTCLGPSPACLRQEITSQSRPLQFCRK